MGPFIHQSLSTIEREVKTKFYEFNFDANRSKAVFLNRRAAARY